MASVPKQTVKSVDGSTLDPRATRYGIIPIFSQQTASRDFYVWEIPANKVFPFRPFIGEIGQDHKGRELYRTERLPADQIADLQRMTAYFAELPELAKLDEVRAEIVANVLVNPKTCTKYAIELENSCASCWLEYLYSNEFADRVRGLEGNDLQRAANSSVATLKEALQKAIGRARELVDEAIRDIDDPTKGKRQFYDKDYLNIYHTHTDRPKYKTQTSNVDSAQAIADAIKAIAQPAPAQSGVSVEQFEQLLAMATEMKAKLDEYEKVEPAAENKAAKIKEKIKEVKED